MAWDRIYTQPVSKDKRELVFTGPDGTITIPLTLDEQVWAREELNEGIYSQEGGTAERSRSAIRGTYGPLRIIRGSASER